MSRARPRKGEDDNQGYLEDETKPGPTVNFNTDGSSDEEGESFLSKIKQNNEEAALTLDLTRIIEDEAKLPESNNLAGKIAKVTAALVISALTAAQPFINSLLAPAKLPTKALANLWAELKSDDNRVWSVLMGIASLINNIAIGVDYLPKLPGKLRNTFLACCKSIARPFLNAFFLLEGLIAGMSLGGLAVKAFVAFGTVAQSFFGAMSALVNFATRFIGLDDAFNYFMSLISATARNQKKVIDKLNHIDRKHKQALNQQIASLEQQYKCKDITQAEPENQQLHYQNSLVQAIKSLDNLKTQSTTSSSESTALLAESNIFDETRTRRCVDTTSYTCDLMVSGTFLMLSGFMYQILYSQSFTDFGRFIRPFNNDTGTDDSIGNFTRFNESDFELMSLDFNSNNTWNQTLPAQYQYDWDKFLTINGVSLVKAVALFAGLPSAILGGLRAGQLPGTFLDTCYKTTWRLNWRGAVSTSFLLSYWFFVALSSANMVNVAQNQIDQANRDAQNANNSEYLASMIWAIVLTSLDSKLIQAGAALGAIGINSRALGAKVYADKYEQNPTIDNLVAHYKDPTKNPLPAHIVKAAAQHLLLNGKKEPTPKPKPKSKRKTMCGIQ